MAIQRSSVTISLILDPLDATRSDDVEFVTDSDAIDPDSGNRSITYQVLATAYVAVLPRTVQNRATTFH